MLFRSESQPGRGSAFHVYLPYKQPEKQDEGLDRKNKQLKKTKKILIVEDEPDNFRLLKEFFRNTNITVVHAESGEKCLELCRNHNDIDLILMDLRLPGIDGVKTTRKIKENLPDIPVIAQTAYTREQYDKDKGLFVDFLTKPIKREIFMEVTQKYFDGNF